MHTFVAASKFMHLCESDPCPNAIANISTQRQNEATVCHIRNLPPSDRPPNHFANALPPGSSL